MQRTVRKCQRNTHGWVSLTLSWEPQTVECCGQVLIDEDFEPEVWDTSGLGDWTPVDHRQCRQCGSVTSIHATVEVRS